MTMHHSLSGKYAIVGVAESDLGVVGPERTELSLQVQASLRALDDAGLSPRDVDGVFVQPGPFERMPGLLLAEYLGIQPRMNDTTMVGGCSNLQHIEHAIAAIDAGLCEVALVAYGSTQRSAGTRKIGGVAEDPRSPRGQFDVPYGLLSPIGPYALATARYRHLYGLEPEDLGSLAIATRQWANLNPVAYRHDQRLTMDAYRESPMISWPLRRDDICLVTDGGGAVIVTSMERARNCGKPPVVILGAASRSNAHYWIAGLDDILTTGAAVTGAEAMATAGVGPQDIDVLEIYDAFTTMPLLAVENLGFCARGEGRFFFHAGRTAPGGEMPMNTSGGGLSYCHPGMFGIFLLIEAVRQLRGECGPRQVPEAHVVLCHAYGGVFSAESTAVLGRE